MRIAAISDIHANSVALNEVFSVIASANIDKTVCLGDIATLGPSPNEVVNVLREYDWTFIRGNHDDYLFDPELLAAHSDKAIIRESIEWSRARLSQDNLRFIRNHQTEPLLFRDCDVNLAFYHGSPRSNIDDILSDTDQSQLDAMLGGTTADVFVGGHTHIQMLRQHRGLLIVNAGSVGIPFFEYVRNGNPEVMPYAEFAIIDVRHGRVSAELVKVALNKRKLILAVSKSDNPICRFLESQYIEL